MSPPRLIGLSLAAGATAAISEYVLRALSAPYSIENYGMLLRIFVVFTAAATLLCFLSGLVGSLLSRWMGVTRGEGATAGVLSGVLLTALFQLGVAFPGSPLLHVYWLALAGLVGFVAFRWLIRGVPASQRRFLEATWPAAAPLAGWCLIAQALQQNRYFPGPWVWALALLWIAGTVAIAVAVAKRPGLGHAMTGAGMAACLVGAVGIPVSPDLARPGPVTQSSAADATPVILLTVDTLRRDSLSLYGGPSPTPALDALGADGIVFDRAYSTAPWTYVSFPSIHSGLTPWGHGVLRDGDGVSRRTSALALALQDRGYTTGAIGGNGLLGAVGPLKQLGVAFGDRNFYPRTLRPQIAAQLYLQRNYPNFLGVEASTGKLARYGAQWVRNHKSVPFLLWLHFFDPHQPYERVSRFPPAYEPSEQLASASWAQLDTMLRFGPRLPGLAQWVRALYQSELQNVDWAIGGFLQTLKDEGVYERALIVFTSDHGEEFGEHNEFYHGQSLYEELVRVPLILKLPGAAQHPRRVDQIVSTVSVLPTILELTGTPYEPKLYSGESLHKAWQSDPGSSAPPAPVFMTGVTQRKEAAEAVVWDHYKFISWTNVEHEELYDLDADPHEQHNTVSHELATAALGRALLADHAERESERARQRGFRRPESKPLTPAEQDILRGLGYLQ